MDVAQAGRQADRGHRLRESSCTYSTYVSVTNISPTCIRRLFGSQQREYRHPREYRQSHANLEHAVHGA